MANANRLGSGDSRSGWGKAMNRAAGEFDEKQDAVPVAQNRRAGSSTPARQAGGPARGRVARNRPALPSAEAPPPIFEIRGLSKTYQMGEVQVEALRGVDLDLFEGELVVLLGPSGSGKSTLLNILGGLDAPSRGSVRYGDHDLSVFDDAAMTRDRREHVGFMFQFNNLIPSLTARENVALVTEIAAAPMAPEEALAMVGLGGRLDHFPTQLSGGEQQRVAIARAVSKRPQVLLCDEPTGALDAPTGVLVLDVIARVNRELGTTTAVITHNSVIAEMADRVVHFGDGRVVSVATNAEKKSPAELSW